MVTRRRCGQRHRDTIIFEAIPNRHGNAGRRYNNSTRQSIHTFPPLIQTITSIPNYFRLKPEPLTQNQSTATRQPKTKTSPQNLTSDLITNPHHNLQDEADKPHSYHPPLNLKQTRPRRPKSHLLLRLRPRHHRKQNRPCRRR